MASGLFVSAPAATVFLLPFLERAGRSTLTNTRKSVRHAVAPGGHCQLTSIASPESLACAEIRDGCPRDDIPAKRCLTRKCGRQARAGGSSSEGQPSVRRYSNRCLSSGPLPRSASSPDRCLLDALHCFGRQRPRFLQGDISTDTQLEDALENPELLEVSDPVGLITDTRHIDHT